MMSVHLALPLGEWWCQPLGELGRQSSTILGKKYGFSIGQMEFDVLMENLCKAVQYVVEKCFSGVEVIAVDEDAQGELDRIPVSIIIKSQRSVPG